MILLSRTQLACLANVKKTLTDEEVEAFSGNETRTFKSLYRLKLVCWNDQFRFGPHHLLLTPLGKEVLAREKLRHRARRL